MNIHLKVWKYKCKIMNIYIYVLSFSLSLYLRHSLYKKIPALVETTRDHAAVTVKSSSTVFSVPQQQRAAESASSAQMKSSAFKYTQ